MNKKEKKRAFSMSMILGGMGDTVEGLTEGILLNGWGELTSDGNLVISQSLYLSGASLVTELPEKMIVNGDLDLSDCDALEYLPSGLRVKGNLNLSGCELIEELPEDLRVDGDLFIDWDSDIDVPEGIVGGEVFCTYKDDNFFVNKKEKMRAFTMSMILGGMGDTVERLTEGILLNGWGKLTSDGSLVISQSLYLSGAYLVKELPEGMFVHGDLDLSDCDALEYLPSGLRVKGNLNLSGCELIEELPEDLRVDGDLLIDSESDIDVPEGVVGGEVFYTDRDSNLFISRKETMRAFSMSTILGGMGETVERLTEGILFNGWGKLTSDGSLVIPQSLYLSGAGLVTELPEKMIVHGDLDLSDCDALEHLPSGLRVKGNLNLSGCEQIKELPEDLRVDGDLFIDLGSDIDVPEGVVGGEVFYTYKNYNEEL